MNVKRGDYVIMSINNDRYNSKLLLYKNLKSFIENNIGKVAYVMKNHWESTLTVEYENVPDDIKAAFNSNKYKTTIKYWYIFEIKDIVDYNKSEKELQYILQANKYNL